MNTLFHRIGGVVVNEPLDFDSCEHQIDRDFTTRILAPKFPTTLKWDAKGYDLLRSMFLSDRCSITDYELHERCGNTTYLAGKAKIILSDCEWRLAECSVDVSLVDEGIEARIRNNRKVPVRPSADKTKNAFPLTPAAEILVDMFDPQDVLATYAYTDRRMYDWKDAMQHCLSYITDTTVSFQSAWYDALPDDERYAVTTGFQIRLATAGDAGLALTYNFEDLFFELAKKYDLWLFVSRASDGSAIVNIEQDKDLWGALTVVNYPSQRDLVQSIDTDRLYAKVTVGSDQGLPNLDASLSLPFLLVQGHSKEEFHFTGVCNTDAELDLVNKWNICTNLIERAVTNLSNASDKETFIIQYDRTDPGDLKATKSDWYAPGSTPYLYNVALLNFNVLNRYALPSQVASYSASANAEFAADRSISVANPTSVLSSGSLSAGGQAQFDNDFAGGFFDSGDNYGLATVQGTPVSQADSIYTAPSQGYYVFKIRRRWVIESSTFPNSPPSSAPGVPIGASSSVWVPHRMLVNSLIRIRRYDAFNTLISTTDHNSTEDQLIYEQPWLAGNYAHEIDPGMVLNAGDYLEVDFLWTGLQTTSVGYYIGSGFFTGNWVWHQFYNNFTALTATVRDERFSFWRTEFVATGGGILTSVDPDAARIVVYETEDHMSASTWASLLTDARGAIGVSEKASNIRRTHIKNLSRNMNTGKTTITTLANFKQPL